MNNEEKNPAVENEAVEENKSSTPAPAAKKLPRSVIGLIIGGFAMMIVAIVLLVTLFPANSNQGGGEQGGGTTGGKVEYTVTIVDQDGNAVVGATVEFTPKGGSAIPFTTDSDGEVSHKSDKEITAAVTALPTGYEYDKMNEAQSFDDEGNLKVTVNKLPPFVILVVDGEGNPISGVRVQMCDTSGTCRIPVTTNAEGKGTYNYEAGEFHAQLTNGLSALPEGYTVDQPDKYYDFVDGVATIIVTKTAD